MRRIVPGGQLWSGQGMHNNKSLEHFKGLQKGKKEKKRGGGEKLLR